MIVIDGTSGITPLAFSSNLQFTSTGQRITGDFSNSTFSNRVAFQSSTLNANTMVGSIPNGSATGSSFRAFNNSDPNNSAYLTCEISTTSVAIESRTVGTGSYIPITFATSGSERMRIDTSGNVGVGMTPLTTSATSMFVNGPITINPSYGTYLVNAHYDGAWKYNGNGVAWGIGNNFSGVTNGTTIAVTSVNSSGANAALTWTPAVNIDTSGNLGLGVTPSAWQSYYKVIDVGSSTALLSVSTSLQSDIWNNSYFAANSTPYFKNNGYASIARQIDGKHQWFTSTTSGTAGAAVSFTNVMTLDASGNLGIGTASPASYGKLAVIGGSIYTDRTISLNYGSSGAPSIDMWGSNNQTYGGATIYMRSSSNGTNYATAGTLLGTIFFGDAYAGGATISGQAAENHSVSALGAYLAFSTTPTGSTTIAERLRIDSSGNVWQFVNGTTTSAYYKFGDASTAYAQVAGYYDSSTTGHLEFYTLNTTSGERMRITAEGNVGIGTGSPVNPGTGLYSALTINNTIGGAIYLQSSGSNVISLTGDSSGAWLYAIGASNSMILGSNGLERLRADPSGNILISTNTLYTYQPAPTSKAAAATLTGAELMTGILNTTGTTYTITLPTGTNIQSAVSSSMGINNAFDWTVINTASGTITIGANGNTTLGSLTIATGVSAGFRFRRTGANLFTVYRIR